MYICSRLIVIIRVNKIINKLVTMLKINSKNNVLIYKLEKKGAIFIK